jgi:sigma-E factor negative regulatory protein RseC
MDQDAIVRRVERGLAFVEAGGADAGCGRCHEKGGCQNGLFGQLFRSGPRQYRIVNSIDAVPGERVIVRVQDGVAIGAAMLAYGLPVIFLLLGASAGAALAETDRSDAATALGALVGLGLGVLCGPLVRHATSSRFTAPTLVRRSSNSCVAKVVSR